jgi:hypothetical protein
VPSQQTEQAERVRTVEELREFVLQETGSLEYFSFIGLGSEYLRFWHDMNGIEGTRGYLGGEYEKADCPSPASMKLLTEEEFEGWKERFRSLGPFQS